MEISTRTASASVEVIREFPGGGGAQQLLTYLLSGQKGDPRVHKRGFDIVQEVFC